MHLKKKVDPSPPERRMTRAASKASKSSTTPRKRQQTEESSSCGPSKKKFKKVTTQASGNSIIHSRSRSQDNEVKRQPKKAVRKKGSPKRLIGINNLLSDAQKDKIQNIGFAGLLNIRCTSVPEHLSLWLINIFDVANSELVVPGRGIVKVDDDAVHKILGIPQGDLSIHYDQMFGSESFKLFYKTFGHEDDQKAATFVEVEKWFHLVDNKGRTDENFIWHWLSLAVSSLLCATTAEKLSVRCFHAILDCQKIKEYNWCALVVNQLKKGIKDLKEQKKQAASGCLFFLVILYLDALDTGDLIDQEEQIRVSAWTDQLVNKVINMDRLSTSSFGKLMLKDQYPIRNETLLIEPHKVEQFVHATAAEGCIPGVKNVLLKALKDYSNSFNQASIKLIRGVQKGLAGASSSTAPRQLKRKRLSKPAHECDVNEGDSQSDSDDEDEDLPPQTGNKQDGQSDDAGYHSEARSKRREDKKKMHESAEPSDDSESDSEDEQGDKVQSEPETKDGQSDDDAGYHSERRSKNREDRQTVQKSVQPSSDSESSSEDDEVPSESETKEDSHSDDAAGCHSDGRSELREDKYIVQEKTKLSADSEAGSEDERGHKVQPESESKKDGHSDCEVETNQDEETNADVKYREDENLESHMKKEENEQDLLTEIVDSENSEQCNESRHDDASTEQIESQNSKYEVDSNGATVNDRSHFDSADSARDLKNCGDNASPAQTRGEDHHKKDDNEGDGEHVEDNDECGKKDDGNQDRDGQANASFTKESGGSKKEEGNGSSSNRGKSGTEHQRDIHQRSTTSKELSRKENALLEGKVDSQILSMDTNEQSRSEASSSRIPRLSLGISSRESDDLGANAKMEQEKNDATKDVAKKVDSKNYAKGEADRRKRDHKRSREVLSLQAYIQKLERENKELSLKCEGRKNSTVMLLSYFLSQFLGFFMSCLCGYLFFFLLLAEKAHGHPDFKKVEVLTEKIAELQKGKLHDDYLISRVHEHIKKITKENDHLKAECTRSSRSLKVLKKFQNKVLRSAADLFKSMYPGLSPPTSDDLADFLLSGSKRLEDIERDSTFIGANHALALIRFYHPNIDLRKVGEGFPPDLATTIAQELLDETKTVSESLVRRLLPEPPS